MDHKQALAVLHRVYEAYMHSVLHFESQLSEREALRFQGLDALEVLARSILGEPPHGHYEPLCDVCHVAYGLRHVTDGYMGAVCGYCCDSCLPPLLAQGIVCEVNGQFIRG